MRVTAGIKKIKAASKNTWEGIGLENHGGTTATYAVLANGAHVMTISGGEYGYMESPMWDVSCKLSGITLRTFARFSHAREWATSDAGLVAWTDHAWKPK